MRVTQKEIVNCISQSEAPTIKLISEGCGAGSVCGICVPILAQLTQASSKNKERGIIESLPWKGLFVVSALAALLTMAIVLIPKIPASQTVQTGFRFDELIRSNSYKQITGFTVIALLVIGMILTLRKRLKWFTKIKFSNFRMFHMVSGILGLLLVGLHTGFSLGNNFNFLLMLNYLLLSAVGAMAGITTALSNKNQSPGSVAVRRFSTIGHIILIWPFPVLITYHVLMVYFY